VTTEIVFETHAISTDNEAGIATGWLGGQLSEEGRGLRWRLGERRRGEWIDAVYTSDLGRAVETAELAFGDTGIPIRQDARLRECSRSALRMAGGMALRADR
jgi:broad specificity phosphatase PhoE